MTCRSKLAKIVQRAILNIYFSLLLLNLGGEWWVGVEGEGGVSIDLKHFRKRQDDL